MDGVSGYLSFLMDKLEAMLCTGNYQVWGKARAASPDFPSNVRGPKQPVGAPVYGLSTGVSGSGFIIPIDGNDLFGPKAGWLGVSFNCNDAYWRCFTFYCCGKVKRVIC